MSALRVKTSQTQVAYFVQCDSTEHQVIFNIDGNMTHFSHDVEAETVTEFLGGEVSACSKARKLHESVINYLAIEQGITDADNLVSLGEDQWKTRNNTCPSCASQPKSLRHFNSLDHALGSIELQDFSRQAKAVIKRMKQVREHVDARIKSVPALGAALGCDLNVDHSSRGVRSWMDPLVASRFITSHFAGTIAPLVSQNPNIDYVFYLRDHFTVQWLNEFLDSLSEKAMRKVSVNPELMRKVSKARNRPADKVAEFVNSGIYSDIYTYIENQITPEQALMIFEQYPHAVSAKQVLETHGSIGNVLHEIRQG